MLSAFLKFVDDELNPPVPGSSVETGSVAQRAAAAAPTFASTFESALLAIEERRFGDARGLVDALLFDFSRDVTSGSDASLCPYCARRVLRVEVHSRTCSARPTSDGANVVAAVPLPLDPQVEMAEAAKLRLARAVVTELRDAAVAPELARQLWCVGAGLCSVEAIEDAGGKQDVQSDRCADAATSAFSDVVVRLFSSFCSDVRRELDSITSMRAIGASWARGGSSGPGAPPAVSALPPFLAKFKAVLGPPPWDATGRPCAAVALSPLPGPTPAGSPPQASGSSSTAKSGDASVPHIDAVTKVLSEASSWLVSIMQQPVAHGDRCFVANALHASCASACLPLLQAYHADLALGTVTSAAAALLEHVSRVPVRSGASDPLALTISVTLPSLVNHGGKSALSGSAAAAPASGLVRAASGLQSRQHAQQQSPLQACLPIYAGAVLAIVDVVADQTSFLCQLLERYLRCLTVCTAAGPAGQPSRISLADSLVRATQEFQGIYVALEHAYAVAATRQLVCSRDGWSPVHLHEDPRVATFAWVDDTLFVLSKSLARSASTCCDMAAAAALNYAAEAVEEVVGAAGVHCLELAVADADHAPSRAAAAHAATATVTDNEESALAAHLSSVLLGSNAGAPAPSSAAPPGGSSPPRSSRRAPDIDAASAHFGGIGAASELRQQAVCAVNSLFTALDFLRSMLGRTLGQLTAAYADERAEVRTLETGAPSLGPTDLTAETKHLLQLLQAAEAGGSEAALSAGPVTALQAAADRILRAFPLGAPAFLEGDLGCVAAAVSAVRKPLQHPLLQLHRVCAPTPRAAVAGAWLLAASCSAAPLRRIATLTDTARYVLSGAEYEMLCQRDPLVTAVASDVLGGVIGSGGASGAFTCGTNGVARAEAGEPTRPSEGWLTCALQGLVKPDAAAAALACTAVLLAEVLADGSASRCAPGGGRSGAPSAGCGWRCRPANALGALLMQSELREASTLLAAARAELSQDAYGEGGGGGRGAASSGGGGRESAPLPSALSVAAIRAAFAPIQQRLAVLTVTSLDDVPLLPFPRPLLPRAEVVRALLQRVDLPGVYVRPAPPLPELAAGGAAADGGAAAAAAAAASAAVRQTLSEGVDLACLRAVPWDSVPVVDPGADTPVDAVVRQWLTTVRQWL